MKEGHADAVHMEAAAADAPELKALIHAGVPVMGHLGITKQKIVRTGRDSDPGPDGCQRSLSRGRRCGAGERRCLCLDPGMYARTASGRSSPAAWKSRPSGLAPDQTVTVRHW